QAEDGIRDRNVTGVQTCALPIYLGDDDLGDLFGRQGLITRQCAVRMDAEVAEQLILGHDALLRIDAASEAYFSAKAVDVVRTPRSEERRVGKECDFRGVGMVEKK